MLWYTTVINWDSYGSEKLIVRDLKKYGIRWVMNTEGSELVFLSPEAYAKKAVQFDRSPKIIGYPYDLLPELQAIK